MTATRFLSEPKPEELFSSGGGAIFIGQVIEHALRTAPALYLDCDGTAQSRSTYSALFSAIMPSLGAATVTTASPGVWTLNAHGLVDGDAVVVSSSGAVSNITLNTTVYYLVSTTTNTFRLSATRGGAAINVTSQSGTHSLRFCPYGPGDGSTTFNVPNYKGRVGAGKDSAQTEFDNIGESGGAKTHTLATGELPSHTHSTPAHSHTVASHSHTINHGHSVSDPGHTHGVHGSYIVAGGDAYIAARHDGGYANVGGIEGATTGLTVVSHSGSSGNASPATDTSGSGTSGTAGSGTAHNNLQPYVVLNHAIYAAV